MSVDDVYIISTTEFTSSAIQFRDELRSYQGVVGKTAGIDEWTGSTVNYLHVGDWYFSASFSQSAANTKELQQDLSADWNFDSTGSGENQLIDNTGTYSGSFGSQTFIRPDGLYGNAAHFDGTGDYITITPSLTYKAIDNFTFTTWFNLAGGGGGSYSRIVKSLYREDRMTIIQFVNSNSKLRIRRNEDDEEEDIGYDLSSMAGEWHFLTVVRNAEGWYASLDANSTLTFIIDAGDGIVDFELISATGPQSMSGSLDSLKFHDRQLSQTEITQLYNLRGQPLPYLVKQATPHGTGLEIICNRGRNFKTLKYVDKAAYESILDTNYWLTSPFLNPITESIKKTRGVNLTHTQSPDPPLPPG